MDYERVKLKKLGSVYLGGFGDKEASQPASQSVLDSEARYSYSRLGSAVI